MSTIPMHSQIGYGNDTVIRHIHFILLANRFNCVFRSLHKCVIFMT
jgi:hypothetical protein